MARLRKKLEGISLTEDLKKVLDKICHDCQSDDADFYQLDATLKDVTSKQFISISAISLAKSILLKKRPSDINTLHVLSNSLNGTKLCFSQPQNQNGTTEEYTKRINRLKLQQQERNYLKLTSNLDKTPADDATIKSMMYAATIGANMIVAPISIGVLMYFFAGKLFSFITPDYTREEGKVDIPGMIAGVITGAMMLFIEMILFVIRNHEMDKFVTKKMKKGKHPFGYDKKAALRTFNG